MRFNSDSIWKSLFLRIKKMKMKKLIIMFISVISIYSVSAQKYTDQYIKDASKVAETWLSNINNKQYLNAFQLLSNDVKAIYKQEIWINQIIELMNERGKLKSRLTNDRKFQSEVKGMENGFYVFISYTSDYENTKNYLEHLLLKQNDKMKWEIVNYSYEFQNKEK